jgi:hypothetical protein
MAAITVDLLRTGLSAPSSSAWTAIPGGHCPSGAERWARPGTMSSIDAQTESCPP